MIIKWESLYNEIDFQRFKEVSDKLQIQLVDAKKWRDTCITYFAGVSEKPYNPTDIKSNQVDQQMHSIKLEVISNQRKLKLQIPNGGELCNSGLRIELFDLCGRLVLKKELQSTVASEAIVHFSEEIATGEYVSRLTTKDRILMIKYFYLH
jgi:hypothetical protein